MDPRTKVLAGIGGGLALLLLALFAVVITTGDTGEPTPAAEPTSTATAPGQSGSHVDEASQDGSAVQDPELAAWAEENAGRFPPAAADGASFPALPDEATTSAEGFLSAFYEQLLTVDYAADSWDEAMAWVRYETAPPGEAGDTAGQHTLWLLSTLTDPPKSERGVIPTEDEWARYAQAGTVQVVDGVTVLPNQVWEDKVTAGTVRSSDPNSDCLDVTVTLHRTTGKQESRDALTFMACTGSAAEHDGYGFAGVALVKDAR
ncbi:hypothetical protein GCM10009795_096960 [Nocardioides hankookensis]|uniref:Secreted protein n=1 Tax=Nocardioides hankookensis TaxID=443157 RepID=A0ABW1LNV3_9ACTN